MTDKIKSMKLYTAVDRIYADLAALGHDRHSPLTVDELNRFDQLHYFGTEAVDEAVSACAIGAGSRVLDVGSGFGGPARYIAERVGAVVRAVELQPDLNETAADLTARCGLAERVEHVAGDILETPLEGGSYDAAVSWLALYHIPEREPLFPRINTALKPGGRIYVEDLYRRGDLTAAEEEAMRVMLFANTLPRRDAYVEEVTTAGLRDVDFTDMTDAWADFTAERLAMFRAGRDAYIEIHGAETFSALEDFYDCIAGLLAAGRVGGVRMIATK